jgi:uncharacterized repeat protein (TIGR03843 family)
MTGARPDGGGAPQAAAVPAARALALLSEGEIELLGRIPWASNATMLAEVRHQELSGLAVYKPERGERPLWDFPGGTLYRREVAAYRVSEWLGWSIVPLTVARDGPFGIGSLQLWVDADPEVTAFDLLADCDPVLPRIAAFDVVVNNADRKAGHCLRDGDGRVWAIDHGVCFHAEPKLRTVLWDLADQRLDARVVADLGRLADEVDGELGDALEVLLEPDERAALVARARSLAQAGQLPRPRSGRAYPWPLV